MVNVNRQTAINLRAAKEAADAALRRHAELVASREAQHENCRRAFEAAGNTIIVLPGVLNRGGDAQARWARDPGKAFAIGTKAMGGDLAVKPQVDGTLEVTMHVWRDQAQVSSEVTSIDPMDRNARATDVGTWDKLLTKLLEGVVTAAPAMPSGEDE